MVMKPKEFFLLVYKEIRTFSPGQRVASNLRRKTIGTVRRVNQSTIFVRWDDGSEEFCFREDLRKIGRMRP